MYYARSDWTKSYRDMAALRARTRREQRGREEKAFPFLRLGCEKCSFPLVKILAESKLSCFLMKANNNNNLIQI